MVAAENVLDGNQLSQTLLTGRGKGRGGGAPLFHWEGGRNVISTPISQWSGTDLPTKHPPYQTLPGRKG